MGNFQHIQKCFIEENGRSFQFISLCMYEEEIYRAFSVK